MSIDCRFGCVLDGASAQQSPDGDLKHLQPREYMSDCLVGRRIFSFVFISMITCVEMAPSRCRHSRADRGIAPDYGALSPGGKIEIYPRKTRMQGPN